MLINKLRDYYGIADADAVDYINKRTAGMSEEQQNEIADKIIQSRQKRFGFPDISILAKFLNDGGKKTRGFYWAVCNTCKAEYDYRFESCPKCHLEKRTSSGYAVRTSEYQPPRSVIRWNQETLHPEEGKLYCINCEHRDNGYCRWFGEPNYTCKQEEYEYCPCKKCCAVHKRANAKALQAVR